MAGEADLQPAVRWRMCQRAPRVRFDDGGQGAADLRCGQVFGEHVAAGRIGEEMEGSATVGDGAADCGIGAVGGDESLLDCGVALGAPMD